MIDPDLSHIVDHLQQLAVPVESVNLDVTNARMHSRKNLDAIRSSLQRFGQRRPIVVQRDGMVVRAGNGTLTAARELGWTHIAAVVVDDDNATAVQYAIADNRTAELAEWDPQILPSLLSAMTEEQQASLGFDQDDIAELLGDGLADTPFSTKVQSPIYTPSGPCPPVSELYDASRADKLLAEIDAATDIPDDLREFLRLAAIRHVTIRFDRVANYYAHAPAHIQRLFEDSALVIIDFNRAIELGFVRLEEGIQEALLNDHPDA